MNQLLIYLETVFISVIGDMFSYRELYLRISLSQNEFNALDLIFMQLFFYLSQRHIINIFENLRVYSFT